MRMRLDGQPPIEPPRRILSARFPGLAVQRLLVHEQPAHDPAATWVCRHGKIARQRRTAIRSHELQLTAGWRAEHPYGRSAQRQAFPATRTNAGTNPAMRTSLLEPALPPRSLETNSVSGHVSRCFRRQSLPAASWMPRLLRDVRICSTFVPRIAKLHATERTLA